MLGFGATGQFAIGEVNLNEPTTLDKWFRPLGEPVRSLKGLTAAPQFIAAPVQLRPTPTTTGKLAATETKDTFLGGAQSWNRITSAEMGFIENKTPQAEIGVSEVQGVFTAKMSISIL